MLAPRRDQPLSPPTVIVDFDVVFSAAAHLGEERDHSGERNFGPMRLK